MIRAIQDFEPMKMFTPNEYILLGHPNSRQFVEDPLVQDESNVVEVRIAPPDGFLIKRDPIKMNALLRKTLINFSLRMTAKCQVTEEVMDSFMEIMMNQHQQQVKILLHMTLYFSLKA